MSAQLAKSICCLLEISETARQITTCDLMEVNLSMQFQTFLDFWWCHLVFVDSSALALDTMLLLSCNALVANKSRK
jgi:hypothetical protein